MIAQDGRFRHTIDVLAAADPDLDRLITHHGRPVLWSRPATFASLTLLIAEQQVSLASGQAVFARLRAHVGQVVPDRVAVLTEQDLRTMGFTRQKASYVRGLATGIIDGTIDWPVVTGGEPDAARRTLLAIRGIGPWTADVWLLACLLAPDMWPVGDRALQVGVAEVIGAPEPLVGQELVDVGERWAPHRSTAARLVWHAYLSVRGRAEAQVPGLDSDAVGRWSGARPL